MTNAEKRTPTPIDTIAEEWVDTQLELFPEYHVYLGRPGREGEYADYSPAGAEARRREGQARRSPKIEAAEPVDDIDRVTKMDLARELRARHREARGRVRPARPQRHRVARPGAARHLRPGADRHRRGLGRTSPSACTTSRPRWTATSRRCAPESPPATSPAIRQVREVAAQASKQVAANGFFFEFTGDAKRGRGRAARIARAPTSPRAPAESAEAYARARRLPRRTSSRRTRPRRTRSAASSTRSPPATSSARPSTSTRPTSGASRSSRAWSPSRSRSPARSSPARSVREAIEFLDGDPSRKLHGTDALQTLDAADERPRDRRARADRTSTSPTEIRRLECMIAPTQEGGIYYTAPDRRLLARRAGCGGASPRASPSSTPGVSSRPCTTRAFPATTCRSPRPSTTRRS